MGRGDWQSCGTKCGSKPQAVALGPCQCKIEMRRRGLVASLSQFVFISQRRNCPHLLHEFEL